MFETRKKNYDIRTPNENLDNHAMMVDDSNFVLK